MESIQQHHLSFKNFYFETIKIVLNKEKINKIIEIKGIQFDFLGNYRTCFHQEAHICYGMVMDRKVGPVLLVAGLGAKTP